LQAGASRRLAPAAMAVHQIYRVGFTLTRKQDEIFVKNHFSINITARNSNSDKQIRKLLTIY
jgi:hypothetical protein